MLPPTTMFSRFLLIIFCLCSPALIRAQQMTLDGLRSFSSSDVLHVHGSYVNSQGTLFISGVFSGNMTLGSLTLTSQGALDRFLGRMEADGTWTWAKRYGCVPPNDYGDFYAHGLRSMGPGLLTVHVSGEDPFTFGDEPTLYSSQECFLLVTEAGDLVGVSAQLFSPASVDAFQSQASPTGELIYAGKRYGNNNILGPDTILLTTGMDGTCFVGAANSGGVWQWGIGFSNEFGVVPHKMAIGPNGEVALVTYVVNAGNPALAVGTVGSSIALPAPSAGQEHLLTLIDANGDLMFSRWLNDPGSQGQIDCSAMCFLPDGDLLFAGQAGPYTVLGGTVTPPVAGSVLATMDMAGNWTGVSWGTVADLHVTDMIPMACDRVVLIGSTFFNSGEFPGGLEFLQNTMFMGIWSLSQGCQAIETLTTDVEDSSAWGLFEPQLFPLSENKCAAIGRFTNALGVAGQELTTPNYQEGWISQWDLGCMGLGVDAVAPDDCGAGPQGSVQLCVDGGTAPYTFDWSNGATDQNLSNLAAGTYSVTVSDALGCTATLTSQVPGPLSEDGPEASILLVNGGRFRPGFPVTLYLLAQNAGCTASGGEARCVLPSDLVYQSADPAPSSINGDTLIWGSLELIFGGDPFYASIHVLTDSTALVGDTVCALAMVTTSPDDVEPSNNVFELCEAVVNSLDPNFKEVSPAGVGSNGSIPFGQELTYTIHFQNTGTAPAYVVTVVDTLDAGLDVSSFQVLATSHPMELEIREGHILLFHFNPIELPDSASDEEHSHGFVMFAIDPLPGLPLGTTVTNGAHIYFDTNPAIATNQVLNTFDETSGDQEVESSRLLVWPDPASSFIHLNVPDGRSMDEVRIHNSLGQCVRHQRANSPMTTIDVSSLPVGSYVIVCGALRSRFVKH